MKSKGKILCFSQKKKKTCSEQQKNICEKVGNESIDTGLVELYNDFFSVSVLSQGIIQHAYLNKSSAYVLYKWFSERRK